MTRAAGLRPPATHLLSVAISHLGARARLPVILATEDGVTHHEGEPAENRFAEQSDIPPDCKSRASSR